VLQLGAGAAAAAMLPTLVRAQSSKKIHLAGVIPLTGTNSAWGHRTWNGFMLGSDIINRKGGIKSMDGAKLRYSVVDSESKPEVAASQTEKVIGQGAAVVFGCIQSAATIVATQVAEREGVPFVNTTDVDPLITSRGFKYTFRTSPLVGNYALDLLAYIKKLGEMNNNPAKKLAILSENSVVGQSANKAATKVANELGYDLVEAATYDAAKTQNFASYIAKYKGAGVEVLIGHNKPNDAILITRTMKELNFNPKAYGGILGGHVSGEYVNALSGDSDHVLGSMSWSPSLDIPDMTNIAKEFKDRFGEAMDSNGAAGVSAAGLIWDGLERAGSDDHKKLRDALAATSLNTGDSMYLLLRGAKFMPGGHNERAGGLVYMIKDKTWLTVDPPQFATAKAVYPKPAWS
jgi:branched-chain amino acid transport system substrate-binding protein